jgi:hypothetical protein
MLRTLVFIDSFACMKSAWFIPMYDERVISFAGVVLHSMLLLVGLAYELEGTSIIFLNGLLRKDQLRDLDSIIRGSRTKNGD